MHHPSLVMWFMSREDGTPSTIAIAVEFIRNEGDAWVWILDHITRLLDAHVPAAPWRRQEKIF